MELRPAIRKLLQESGQSPDEVGLARLDTHADLVREWNGSAALVSKGDLEGDGLIRHYAEALLALPWLAGFTRVADLGSGGGFPVMVWAALQAKLEVIAVESAWRKAAFLRQAAHEMGLKIEVRGERLDSPAALAALGADVLSGRAAGGNDLLLEAGRLSILPLRVILYVGAVEASWFRTLAPDGYRLVHHEDLDPPAEGDPGALVVLDRDVPRGTSS